MAASIAALWKVPTVFGVAEGLYTLLRCTYLTHHGRFNMALVNRRRGS